MASKLKQFVKNAFLNEWYSIVDIGKDVLVLILQNPVHSSGNTHNKEA